jgi:hypothetical protein
MKITKLKQVIKENGNIGRAFLVKVVANANLILELARKA